MSIWSQMKRKSHLAPLRANTDQQALKKKLEEVVGIQPYFG